MTKRTRLILTADGERAFGRLTDGTARALETLLRTEKVKKRDLAERAGIDQAVLSRVLDGTRNLEYRTVAAVVGALGYVFDVVPRKIRADAQSNNDHKRPQIDGGPSGDLSASAQTSEHHLPSMGKGTMTAGGLSRVLF